MNYRINTLTNAIAYALEQMQFDHTQRVSQRLEALNAALPEPPEEKGLKFDMSFLTPANLGGT